MPNNQDITLKILVHDAQGQFRGGTVDVEFKHRTLSDHGTQRGLDASREINIAGLRRAPTGDYQITVTPTDVFEPKSQFVNIPASGFATMKVIIDRVRIPDSRPDPTFVVNGTVRTSTGVPFTNSLVRASHQNSSAPVLLGERRTDDLGSYVIKYSSELVTGAISLCVQVLDENGKVLAQSNSITPAKREEVVNLTLPTPVDEKRFIIRGTVRDVNGKPAIGVTVRAFDRDLRSEEPLGQPTITDKEGSYEITYTAREFSRAEKGSADLRVAVHGPAGHELVTSKILYNAQPEEVVDLVLSKETGGPSECERLIAELTPVLKDVPLHQLNETDIDFLVGDTGEDRQHIVWLARAANLARETSIINIPAEAFYGWFRLNLPTDWEPLRLLPISTLRNTLLAAIDQNIIPARLREEVESILARVPNPQKQDLTNLLTMINLPADRMRAVARTADGIDTISDAALARLVEEHVVTRDEAQSIGLCISLHRLSGGETSLVSTMLSSAFPSVPTGRLRGARDLALLEPADWESALGTIDSPAPNGMPRAQYARSLAMDAVAEFPHAAFVHRATHIPEGIPEKLNAIQPLLAKNANALTLDFDMLDLRDVNDPDQNALRAAHADLKRFANLHPGLGLHEALSKQDGVGNTVKLVDERVGWLSTVFGLNPNVDFLNLDYLPGSIDLKEVHFGDLLKEARGLVLRDLKAHQRIYTVTNNAVPAREIMEAGLHSASAIALTRVPDFAQQTGLPEAEAGAHHAVALELGNAAALQYFKLYAIACDTKTTSIRAIPSHNEFFKPLAGFQELINSQPWCQCAHCQSVLSPAAYFVDLMFYIEENILKDSFRGKENHPLHLRKRRPDLWELELTCKNTDEYVPYLDLVNEILERYLKEVLGPVSSREAPAASSGDLYRLLAAQEGSFKQPFTLPIERLEILLEHFGLTRYDIAKAMGSHKETQARARLKISQREHDLITRERTTTGDLAFFKQLFKLKDAISISSPDALFKPIEMQTLLYATSLAHETVASVLKTQFVNDDRSTNAAIEVVLGKQKPDDVQNNSELVNQLTLRRLDRIHRFVRLWRKLPWTVEELDYVLRQVAFPDPISRIDTGTPGTPGTLERILDLLELNEDWSLPIDELMALSGEFPPKGLREPTSLFDRLFNQPPFLNRDELWPPDPAIRFTHPAWATHPQGVSTPDNNTLSRLLAGLQIEDKELVELIDSLLAILAMSHLAATQEPLRNESIQLSTDSIIILYRHARLMRLLKSTMSDFIKLITLTPRIALRPAAQRTIRDLEDVASVIEFATWQRASGFSLDEIIYVTGDARAQGPLDPVDLSNEIVARVQAEKSLEFVDTVFTQIGLTSLQSRQIVLANLHQNADAFERLGDGTHYRLKAGFDPARTPLVTFDPVSTIDPPIVPLFDPPIVPPVDPMLLSDTLNKYEALRVLDVALGSALNLSPEETTKLRELAHPLDVEGKKEIHEALQGADRIRLTTLLTNTLRYRALFKSRVFDGAGLGFARDHKPVFFGLPGDPAHQAITIQVVRNVAAYVALATATDADFSTASGPPDIEAIQAVIGGVSDASVENLAKALRTEKTRIGALKPHLLTLSGNPFEALEVLARCLSFTERLGISGETLSLMIQEDPSPSVSFDRLSRAAEDVYGAFRAKYPNEKTFHEKMEPFEDKLRPRRRDGLVNFITSKWPSLFTDANKLYEYFLIDVLLEGCVRTSRVVAAISTLQLYVQRVLMNLEWSADWDGNPANNGVYAHFTDLDKQAEWYWREHYRVWEANRKIFLYPENYIEPELRDDKTPPFRELEDSLLRQEITESNVHDAYAKYLIGFDEVAHLKIAGAYYDAHDDALHLFGVTQGAPPVYYYRLITKTLTMAPRISNWQKLTLQIPVRKVSLILFESRLYVFWLETTTKPLNNFVGGTSQFSGYQHTVRIKYSTLRADGTWAPPQGLRFSNGITSEESRTVDDPLYQSAPTLEARRAAARRVVADITGKKNRAADEVRSTALQLNAATTELTKLPSTNDGLEAAAEAFGAEEAARLAYATTLPIGGPVGAAAAAEFVRFGLLAASVRATVQALITAGVSVFDPPFMARRRLALWDARSKWDEATTKLETATRELNAAQGELDRLMRLPDNVFSVRWDKSGRDHSKQLENYTPEGWEWDRVYPDVYSPLDAGEAKIIRLMLVPRNGLIPPMDPLEPLTSDEVDFAAGVLRQLPSTGQPNVEEVTRVNGFPGHLQLINASSSLYAGQGFYIASFWLNYLSRTETPVAQILANSDLQVVNGDPASIIVESNGYAVWMRKEGSLPLLGMRLGTTLTPTLTNRFGHEDANGLLSAGFQTSLLELPPNISPVIDEGDPGTRNPFHRTNPFLTYFRETFFHIPFLVANHLNSQQKFAETQRWYQYIFNPTAADGILWRYRELNDRMISQSLRQMLTDPLALVAYRADPFNPHAIARTRLSAYQKSIVMKYIDNLLDWGDSLFSQFTMESVNEATMLYVMAQEILGPRPPVLGSCGEGKVQPKNYATIRPGLNTVSDFLIELELPRPSSANSLAKGEAAKLVVTKTSGTSKRASDIATTSQSFMSGSATVGSVALSSSSVQGSLRNRPTHDGRVRSLYRTVDLVPPKNAVFCIPPNKDLLAYWSRVEDRLFKIRNCMDIAGVRRHLELFAPEIDPRLLVRMKAAGLTLDDVLNSISGNVPPYRFTYLIDKAKQYAGTLQSFGAQLLSAFEKRDGEELANLRAVHEHNLLKMRTRMTQLEIDAAEDVIESLKRQKTAVEYRQDYFRSLSDVGLVASERAQQQHQREASNFRTQASVVQFIAAVLSIIPDVGAVTAMKFGGSQLGAAGRAAADGLNALAAFNEMSASMAGMEASNQRRDQDWKHQAESAKRDISQIEKQIAAAEIRRDIAVHSLEVHQQTIDQSEEMFEFFRNEKFTNINLYRLLSNQLQRLYRQAYNSALSMAKMTEQAYRAERTDQNPLLDGNYWDAGNAGLLAGERLLIDLQNLERQYLETNYRQLEIEQSFSLAQFSPTALLELRQSGECEFSIPEIFFDLTYPGHYRRRIKGVRLTIPCVTGPYTNVGATLRLTKSKLRAVPDPSITEIPEVPLRHTTAIAASAAQNDGGVFEFSFRDERYMPFEGAGAISDWELSLPRAFHAFDYQTISDVILRIDYTAEEDGRLRDSVQESTDVLASQIKRYLSESGVSHIFSLRRDFPDAWHRLAHSPSTPVEFELTERHLPLLFVGSHLRTTDVDILLQTGLEPISLMFDTTALPGPATSPAGTVWEREASNIAATNQIAGLYKATVSRVAVLGRHTLQITDSGNQGSTSAGGIAAVDEFRLTDILLRMTFRIS